MGIVMGTVAWTPNKSPSAIAMIYQGANAVLGVLEDYGDGSPLEVQILSRAGSAPDIVAREAIAAI